MKSFLKKLIIITLELAVITMALWYIAQKKGIQNVSQIAPAIQQTVENVQGKVQENSFPELSGETTKTFDWTYKNRKYGLDLVLYQSAYEYYRSLPKEYFYSGELPQNWEEEYYARFLESKGSDKTISQLAQKIRGLGEKNKLSENQIVDLVLAFVQSINYDDAKAKNILAKNGSERMLYPYELLWQQSGVCSDKSILAYAILREMGYGAALFIYEDNNHMSVAVQCPKNYSTYGSGYCYAETTSTGNKIGIIPNIDADSNKTVDLSSYSLDKIQTLNLKELGQVTILLASQGKEYSGIVETEKISNEIDSLKKKMEALLPKLKSQKNEIADEEKKLKKWENDLEEYKDAGEYEKYNSLVEEFNDLIGQYKKDVKKYNSDAELYNQYVERYNVLIKQ